MPAESDDAYLVGRLLQWGLRPRDRPAQEPEYNALVDRYLDRREFKRQVDEVARGLGLEVLDASAHGLVLAPAGDSVFALRAAEFRPNRTVEDRLVDGLVQIAIASTVFPRARDLEEDPALARPPVTVDEVDDHLRALCERLAEAVRGEPDPEADDDLAGLEEAWRVVLRRQSVHTGRDGRQSDRATRRAIEVALERLCELGCFARAERAGAVEYQPTWRYQVLVAELAATRLYDSVRRRLGEGG
jgi:hypothetical protein